MKLISPAPFGVANPDYPFGSTRRPYNFFRRHKGKDWQWRTVDPVRSKQTVAPVSGVVKAAYNDGRDHDGWGNHVDIQVTRRVMVRLAHYKTGTVKPRPGQSIQAGDDVGIMGHTGNAAGDHLHEELWIDGVRVAPDLYRGPNGLHLPGTSPVGAPAGVLEDFDHMQVALTSLNLREKPTTSSRILLTMPDRRLVRSSGRVENGFEHVQLTVNGRSYTGWAHEDFLMSRNMRTTVKTTMHKEPRGRVIHTLPAGHKVIVIDSSTGRDSAPWVFVKVGIRRAWVLRENLA